MGKEVDWLVSLCKRRPIVKKALANLGLPTPPVLDRGSGAFPPLGFPLDVPPILTLSATPPGLTIPFFQQWLKSKTLPYVDKDVAFHGSKGQKPKRVVVDCTGLQDVMQTSDLACDVIKPIISNLPKNSRMVLIGKTDGTLQGSAICSGLSSLTRSLSKEIGRNGSTVNIIFASPTVLQEPRTFAQGLVGPLSFFLLPDSAFCTGQELSISSSAMSNTDSWRGAFGLSNKVAVVTGAGRGIGEAIAKRLAAEGATVVGIDLPLEPLKSQLTEVMKGIQGFPLYYDITKPEAPQHICEFLKSKFGGVDIMVHNAGITRDKTLKRMKPENFRQVVDVNLNVVMRLNTALGLDGGKECLVRKGGRVVLMASINGIAGAYGQTNYSLTKAGLIGYAHAMAPLIADKGITINSIAPGFIETDMVKTIPTLGREMGRRSNCLQQGGLPTDIAAAVAFLSQQASQGATGQTLRMCGGNMVGR